MSFGALALLLGVLSGPGDSDWYRFCHSEPASLGVRTICKQVRSEASALQMRSLTGLGGVTIFVDVAPPRLARLGFDRLGVYREVERALGEHGVGVVGEGAALAGRPVLYVRTHLLDGGGGSAWAIALMLFQNVSLKAPGPAAPGVTWEADVLGFSEELTAEEFRASLRTMADYFARDFQAANPAD